MVKKCPKLRKTLNFVEKMDDMLILPKLKDEKSKMEYDVILLL